MWFFDLRSAAVVSILWLRPAAVVSIFRFTAPKSFPDRIELPADRVESALDSRHRTPTGWLLCHAHPRTTDSSIVRAMWRGAGHGEESVRWDQPSAVSANTATGSRGHSFRVQTIWKSTRRFADAIRE